MIDAPQARSSTSTSATWRDGHNDQAPLRARAVPEVPEHRPGQGIDPGAAGRPLHDGRGPHRLHGATPLAGLYAAGEVACVSINGANRLGSNTLPECLVFGARAGRAAAEYASAGTRRLGRGHRPHRAQAEDERRRLDGLLRREAGVEPISPCATRCNSQWSRAPGSTGRRTPWPGPQTSCASYENDLRSPGSRIIAGRSTPSGSPPWNWLHARRGGDHRSLRTVAGGVPWCAPAHRLPRSRRPALPRSFADLPQLRRRAGLSSCR